MKDEGCWQTQKVRKKKGKTSLPHLYIGFGFLAFAVLWGMVAIAAAKHSPTDISGASHFCRGEAFERQSSESKPRIDNPNASPSPQYLHNWGIPDICNRAIARAKDAATVRDWRAPRLLRTLDDHKGTVETLAFSPDGQILASGGGNLDPRIRLWNLETGKKIRTLRGHKTRVLTVAIAPDAQTLVSGSDDSMLNFWNLETGKLTHTFSQLFSNVTSLAISPDGETLVSGGLDGLKLWDLSKQRPLQTLAGFEIFYAVAISPDGRLLASGSKDGTVKVWNLATGSYIGILQGHKKPVNALTFAPDSRTLVTASYDSSIKIWNLETGEVRYTLSHSASAVYSLAVNPRSPVLASAGQDGISLWDLKTGQLLSQFPGHSDWVRAVAFSPDGQLLATGGFDRLVKIWQVDSASEIGIGKK